MKTTEKPVEITLTKLQAANAAHDQALADLYDHRCGMSALRTRCNELSQAIREVNEKAAKQPSMATMSVDEIKALSARKNATFAELAGLNAALDVAENELRNMESDEGTFRMIIDGCKRGAWSALYEQLKEGVDLDLIAKLLTAGFMAGMRRETMVDECFGEDVLDAGLAESLGKLYGLPL